MTDSNDSASPTDCKQQALLFPELTARPVAVDFQAGYVSSDGGGVLLARLDRREGYLERFARCFTDHRDPDLVEHTLEQLLRQRVYALALGYEDLNDHDRLCVDPLLASLCGKSTLNRLELTPAGADASARYKKIVASTEEVEDFFIDEYVRSLPAETAAVTLDLDATDDPLHGHQEGRFFHGYYGGYCYLPLYIFDGDWPIVAWLRTRDRDASDGALGKVQKIAAALRQRFPKIEITLRADSGFCRNALLTWCELHGVFYLFGLARNPVLERKLAAGLAQARALSEQNAGAPARVFVEMPYRAGSWHAARWVVGKAEWTQGAANPRFIITNKNPLRFRAQAL
jgi:hypothetical protein